ncbi:CsbD family protein [Moellerella wisconsensis]|uniref:CsbD-like domain-containing protein n=3 Tax=Moellerella wisconsensis TaxID=158849 RepID=A0A0N0Z711_9GAMM|nr:CsbD family protein [Moellerella wisconsensis]KPD01815.1 hypothetical protein M992_2787 [Moellerella wisconsensis ATCC 35017]UNH43044.1 CsbD family protein [Moellerella wisconsensis]VFS54447.1 CsbD-like [Moellerella wisconsensis]
MKDKIAGDWNLIKGHIIEKWGKLTNNELDIIDGTREQLIGKLQQHYGYSFEEADEEVRKWEGENPYPWK